MPFQIDLVSLSIGILITLLMVSLLQFFYYAMQKNKLRKKEKELKQKIDKTVAEVTAKKKELEKTMDKIREAKKK